MEFLNLIKNDSWLAPFEKVIAGRHQYTIEKQNVLTNSGSHSLASFATGYFYFGLHKFRMAGYLENGLQMQHVSIL
jgi:1,4-alpha-glucan branching enzyme